MAALAIVAAVLTGPLAAQSAGATATSAIGATARASAPQPGSWAAASVPRYQHIVVIADVGHDFGAIYHNRFAPQINRLAGSYGLATRYYTTSDPDIANIVALLAGNSFGVNDSFPYWDEQIHEPSLLSELVAKHMTWKAYMQGLPYPGYLASCYPVRCNGTPDADTFFTYKHDAVAVFASVTGNAAQTSDMVPASRLPGDARAGRLPNFSLVIPDECHDMHGGPPWCEDGTSSYHQPNDNRLVAAGDAYVGQVVRAVMAGPQWQHGNNAIVITFTEGDTTAGCCGAKPGTGHVVTVVITSKGPRGLVDGTPYNHYSLLATIQQAFGLRCLQHTCRTRQVVPMARLFGGSAAAVANSHAVTAGAGQASGIAAAGARADTRTSPAASPWVQVASPNIGPNDNSLGAIAGASPSDIWAVGNYLPVAHPDVTSTLAVHYDGTKWRAVTTPNVGSGQNTLLGVAALPDGAAWAVGDYVLSRGGASHSLIEHWNGTRWSVVASPNPGKRENMLYSIAAISDHDAWAVGAAQWRTGAFHTVIEHWNGTHWSVVASPNPGRTGDFLYSVSAVGGHVFASGQSFGSAAPDRQLVLVLAGHRWLVLPTPDGQAFGATASVSPFAIAASPHGLWLAGFARSGTHGYASFVEHAGEGGFSQLATPNPTAQDNYLWSIAPIGSGDAAWAVGNDWAPSTGNFESLIEFGTSLGGWTIVPSPNPGLANGGNTVLGGVLALGPTNAWAVGAFDGPNGRQTLILHDTTAP